MSTAVPRNSPCPCGSGLKYKRCCELTGGEASTRRGLKVRILATILGLAALATGWQFGRHAGLVVAGCGALLLGLYLYVFDDPPPPSQGGNPGVINFGR